MCDLYLRPFLKRFIFAQMMCIIFRHKLEKQLLVDTVTDPLTVPVCSVAVCSGLAVHSHDDLSALQQRWDCDIIDGSLEIVSIGMVSVIVRSNALFETGNTMNGWLQ